VPVQPASPRSRRRRTIAAAVLASLPPVLRCATLLRLTAGASPAQTCLQAGDVEACRRAWLRVTEVERCNGHACAALAALDRQEGLLAAAEAWLRRGCQSAGGAVPAAGVLARKTVAPWKRAAAVGSAVCPQAAVLVPRACPTLVHSALACRRQGGAALL
jgi:hypothetical protein